MNENALVEQESPQRPQAQKPQSRMGTCAVICVILIIVMAAASLLLFQNLIFNGSEALANGYSAAFLSEQDAAYQALYQNFYEISEAASHVANRASISIGSVRELQKLEVLKVSDVEFMVEDGSNTSWLEVPGEGTFVVDLSAAEFIIDNERSHISVRLPYPELSNITIDYSHIKKLLFQNNAFSNGSYKDGEDLAKKQIDEADLLIKKEFTSNQHFYLNAQEAAVSIMQCLIRKLNPGLDNLTVDVEFY